MNQITRLLEFSIAVFALLLNYPWEFLQVPLFEGMAQAPQLATVAFGSCRPSKRVARASPECDRCQLMDSSFSASVAAESSPVRALTNRPLASKNSVVGSPR